MKKRNNIMHKGDVIWVDLGEHPCSHIQSGRRPCIVINTNKSNGYVYTVIPGSCKLEKSNFPVHIVISPNKYVCGLTKKTVFMAEQITTIDSRQVIMKVGHVPENSSDWKSITDIIVRQLELERDVNG